jgi:hypothetical protein
MDRRKRRYNEAIRLVERQVPMSISDRPTPQTLHHRPPIVEAVVGGPVEDIEQLLGEGSDLWADDAEFEAFLVELRRWRQMDRDTSRKS